jgi:arabinofuranosyltransferase
MLRREMATVARGRRWLDEPSVMVAVGVVAGAIFAVLGHRALASGYPYEDAYILFRYARHLAEGHGIVFNVGGPHTEGATDFLWMTMLAGLARLGVDIAVAAVVLNAAGAVLLASLFCRSLATDAVGGGARSLAYVLAIPAVVLSGAALAAYGGFSSMLYSALVVLLLHVSIHGRGRARQAIPLLAVTLALFRPDGLILGATFALIGAVAAKREGELRPYLVATAVSVLAGVGYFAWRWHYFGLLLPLPLYVKAHPSLSAKAEHFSPWMKRLFTILPGLGANVEWLLGSGVLYILGLVVLGRVIAFRADRAAWRGYVLRVFPFALPFILLLAALSCAHQAQNIDWRFQAPVYMALVYALFSNLAAWWRRAGSARLGSTLLVLAVLLPQSLSAWKTIRVSWDRGVESNYLVSFAPQLGQLVEASERLVVTEAGQIPYWADANVLDVVGLNSAENARVPVTFEQLAKFDPQLVMIHEAGTLELSGPPARELMYVVTPAEVARSVRPEFRALFHDGASSYRGLTISPQRLAPIIVEGFLATHGDAYEILAVDLNANGKWEHLYGLKRDWSKREAVKKILAESLRTTDHESYLVAARRESDRRP